VKDRSNNTPTALVTGAGGFLGRWVSQSFAVSGWNVLPISDSPLQEESLGRILAVKRPQVLVHAAGPSSVPASMADPAADFQRAVGAVAVVLESVRKESAQTRIVFLSSAAVYGDPVSLPVRENQALSPLSPYAFHKLQSELLLREYREIYGIRSVGLRIFSAYGEGMRKQVLWDICRKAADGDLLLQGNGTQSRDFIHADDVASAVLTLASQDGPLPPVINLAHGSEVTIASAASWICEEMGSGLTPRYDGQVPPGVPQRWRADVSLMRSLGWEPKVAPEPGIRAFARWAAADLASAK
jgi:UDP-glucose 4-epimerase